VGEGGPPSDARVASKPSKGKGGRVRGKGEKGGGKGGPGREGKGRGGGNSKAPLYGACHKGAKSVLVCDSAPSEWR